MVECAWNPQELGLPTSEEEGGDRTEEEGLQKGTAEPAPRREELHDARVVPDNKDGTGRAAKEHFRTEEEAMGLRSEGIPRAKAATPDANLGTGAVQRGGGAPIGWPQHQLGRPGTPSRRR